MKTSTGVEDMRVYHYLETKWALDDIRRRRLKLSKIDDMNDPYEWECVCSDHEPSQFALDHNRKQTVEEYGVLCFSLSWNDILMWSHYGERHRGICLGFDVPDEQPKEVTYRGEPLVVGNLADAPTVEQLNMVVDLNGYAKYDGWSYEKEVRIHGTRAEMDEETGKYFVKFGEQLKLKEVIAGARFPLSRRPIEEALRGYSEDVKIVKAARSARKFEIILDRRGFGGIGLSA
jgi:hypothetical protein